MAKFDTGSGLRAKIGRWSAVALLCATAGGGVYHTSQVHAQTRAGAAAQASEPLPPAPDLPGRTLGFVVTYFSLAMYQGEDACPNGLNKVLTTEAFLAAQTPAERDRLLEGQGANGARELNVKMVQRGPNGENVCKAPWVVKDAKLVTLSGDRNDGIDLDGWKGSGAAPADVCPQKQYVGDDGSRGIDNQFGRINACLSGYREKTGSLAAFQLEQMRNGLWSMLIEISGVQNTQNDPDIVVDIYTGQDQMPKDPAGNILSGASLSPKTDKKFHQRFRGRLVNGTVQAERGEKLFIPDSFRSSLPPHAIYQPQIKLTLLPDGGAKGYLGGYRDLNEMFPRSTGMTGFEESTTGYSCDGMYHTLRRFADGAKNAAGTCDRISSAYRIEAIPAFVVHPERQVSAK